jgi:hypothetical protein
MSLADKLADPAVKKNRRTGCAIASIMAEMPKRDREALEAVFQVRDVSLTNVTALIKSEKNKDGTPLYDIEYWHVKEHAAHRCACAY